MKRSELSDVIVELFKEVRGACRLTDSQSATLLAWETDPRITSLDRYTLGETYRCARDFSRAIRSFEGALAAYHPDDEEWIMRGVTFAKIGEGYFQLAQKTFNDGETYDKARPLYDRAIEHYGKALDHAAHILPDTLPTMLCQMAICYQNTQRYGKAQETCARFFAWKEIHPSADPLVVAVIKMVAGKAFAAKPPAAKA